MRTPLSLSLAAMILAGCAGAPPSAPQTPEQTAVSQALWSRAMDKASGYEKRPRTKSMYLCVAWPDGAGRSFNIGGIGVAGESEGTDRPISLGRLQSFAEERCKVHEAEKACTCQELDRNGRNVLVVPEGVTSLPTI